MNQNWSLEAQVLCKPDEGGWAFSACCCKLGWFLGVPELVNVPRGILSHAAESEAEHNYRVEVIHIQLCYQNIVLASFDVATGVVFGCCLAEFFGQRFLAASLLLLSLSNFFFPFLYNELQPSSEHHSLRSILSHFPKHRLAEQVRRTFGHSPCQHVRLLQQTITQWTQWTQ